MDPKQAMYYGVPGLKAQALPIQQPMFPLFDFTCAPFGLAFPAADVFHGMPSLQCPTPALVSAAAGASFVDVADFAGAGRKPLSPSPVELATASPDSFAAPDYATDTGDFPFVPSKEFLSACLDPSVESLFGSPEWSALSSPAPPGEGPPSAGSPDTAPARKKKKRKPKPRMADLPKQEAQAKRDSNRESARKSRDRKREREQSAMGENECLRKEVAVLRLKVQVLTSLLFEKQAREGQATKMRRLE